MVGPISAFCASGGLPESPDLPTPLYNASKQETNMLTRSEEKVPPLNIRIKARQRQLIEEAAKATEKTVSDFVREVAVREAQNTLLDQTTIYFTDAAWEKFTTALDAVPGDNPRLRDLMSRTPTWER